MPAVLEGDDCVTPLPAGGGGLCVGRERAPSWRLPQPVSGGGYHSEQPSAWLNLTGSECCFLRMFGPAVVECSPRTSVSVCV